jgi:hypothetical protein
MVVEKTAHGWHLRRPTEMPKEISAQFMRPAIKAVPPALAHRIGACEIELAERLAAQSRWTLSEQRLDVRVDTTGAEPHDVALEALLCLGQALWSLLSAAEAAEYLRLLEEEITAGVTGEIDDDALAGKLELLSDPAAARSLGRLSRYASSSFAATAAEYVHCLWHDVTVREGSQHLPARWLRRRLELLARWFPPGRGYRLFAE